MASIGTLAAENKDVSITYASSSPSSRAVRIRKEQACWRLASILSGRILCDDGNVPYLCHLAGKTHVDVEHLKFGRCD